MSKWAPLRLLAAASVAMLSLTLVWSSPAAAAPAQVAASATPSANLFCSTGNSRLRYEQQNASNVLPIDRWASATATLHTDFGGGAFGLGLNDLAQRIQRNGIETGSLAAGNALWKAGTDITAASVDFCFGNNLGYTVDHYAAAIGNAIVSSGIVALLVALAIVAFFWRLATKGENTIRKLGRTILVTGVFAAMIAGASASTPTSFGAFSPGWVITSIYSAISGIASLPTMAIAQVADQALTGVTPGSPDLLGCTDYTNQLLRNYKTDYGSGVAAQSAASVPMALDAMWEQTGLRAYQDIQFGQQAPSASATPSQVAVNSYGLRTYCRALEAETGVPQSGQIAVTEAGAAGHLPPGSNPSSAAWLTPGESNSIVDASVVAWAACKYTGSGWRVSAEFQNLGGHSVTTQDCSTWWTTPASSWSPGPFHWPTSTNTIDSATVNSPQVANFLLNWHGDANGQAMATAITFLPASVAVFAVFLLLAGALIIAKMALLALICLFPIVLALSLIPGARWEGAATKVAKYGLGLMVFGVAAQLILSLVAVISSFLVQAGAALFSPGSPMTILWTALAPFAAVWLMHHLFKAIGAPSPFKLNGALGWAAAAGGVGAGIGEGLHRRTAGRASQSLKLAGRNATRSATRFITKPSSRVGGLQPGAPVGTGAGAANGLASAGAVAGAAAGDGTSAGSQGNGTAGPGWAKTEGPQGASHRASDDQPTQRTWLDVPYAEKDEAKAAGAQWDPEAKRWYAPADRAEALGQWLPKTPTSGRAADGAKADSTDTDSAAADGAKAEDQPPKRTWLNVPHDEGDEAKAAGAQWDAAARSWYAPGPDMTKFKRWAPDLSPEPMALSEHLRQQDESRQAASYYRKVLAGPPPEKKPIRHAGALGGTKAFASNRVRGSLYRAKVGRKLSHAAAKERWDEARARFTQAPVRNTLKTAAVVGGAFLVSPVAPIVTAGVVGGVLAARHARRAHLEHPARKAFANRQRIEAWRASQKAQAGQDRRERAAQAYDASTDQTSTSPQDAASAKDEATPEAPQGPSGGEDTGHPGASGQGRPPEPPGPSEGVTGTTMPPVPEAAVVGAGWGAGQHNQPVGAGVVPPVPEAAPASETATGASWAMPTKADRVSGERAQAPHRSTLTTGPSPSLDELWQRRPAPSQVPSPSVRREAALEAHAPGEGAASTVAPGAAPVADGSPSVGASQHTPSVGPAPRPATAVPTKPDRASFKGTDSSAPSRPPATTGSGPALGELWQRHPAPSGALRPARPAKLSAEVVKERMREAREHWQQAPVRSSLATAAKPAVPVAMSVAAGIAAARTARRAYNSTPGQTMSWSELYRQARDISRTSRPSTGHGQQQSTT